MPDLRGAEDPLAQHAAGGRPYLGTTASRVTSPLSGCEVAMLFRHHTSYRPKSLRRSIRFTSPHRHPHASPATCSWTTGIPRAGPCHAVLSLTLIAVEFRLYKQALDSLPC